MLQSAMQSVQIKTPCSSVTLSSPSLTTTLLLQHRAEAASPNPMLSLSQKDLEPKASAVQTYPDSVVLSVLFPVAASVTEHQRIAGYPVGAPIPALGSHCNNLHSVS